MPIEKMMTPKEAAAYLQVHFKTLIKWAEEGKVPGRKLGSLWRFSPSVLEAFLKGNSHMQPEK